MEQILEKLPPQNIEAEEALLGSLLIDKDAIVKIADIITAEDFYKDIHQMIYSAMLEVWEDREPIDILSVANRLEEKKQLEVVGGRSYLATLSNSVPASSHVESYAQIVQKKSTLRRLIKSSTEIIQMAYSEEEKNTVKVLDKAEQKLFSISKKFLKQNFVPLKDTLDQAFERMDELHKGTKKLRGIPTGFADLDNVLAGLQPSELILLAARPSVGKSSLALDFARHVAVYNKVPVGIFSLEMSKEQVTDRMLCAQANVSLWKLRTGNLSHKDGDGDFERLGQSFDVLAEAPIFIDDSPTANMLEIKTKARRLQAEHNVGLIILDYLQLMESGSGFKEGRVQEVSEISRGLKTVARELNIPVLAISQLSRAPEARTPAIPKLSDLRESGCLTGDTLITRADTGARIPIKELVEKTNIPVHSLDEDWQLKEMKISKVFYSGEKMVYELKTRSGFKIKASANHPFKKLEGWTRLDQLRAGDLIATPRSLNLTSPKNELSKNEIILLAHLLGDGCILPNRPYHYTNADMENIKIVKQAAKKLFDIKGRIVKQKNWWHVYLPSPYHLARGTYHPITNWFRRMEIKRVRSWEKQIPGAVFQCDNNRIALFLKHLWATDGNINPRYLPKSKPIGNIYYATTSEKMAEGVKYLLLRIGIRSKISEAKKQGYRMCYHVGIENKKNQLKFLQEIGSYGERGKIIPLLVNYLKDLEYRPHFDIFPKELWSYVDQVRQTQELSWREFSRRCGMPECGSSRFKCAVSQDRLQKILSYVVDPYLYNLANSDIRWDKIVSIKKLGIEKVYDATIPRTHNFVANGIVAHNSLEQDSDVVMFIYRKIMDKGIKVCPEEERNIAEIHLGKHRHGPAGVTVRLFFDNETASFKNLDKKHDTGPESEQEPF